MKKILYKELTNKFDELFQSKPNIYEAPGRINMIGEHTDYNEGFVLPAAIDKAMVFAVQKNDDHIFRLYSYDYKELCEVSSTKLVERSRLWSKYLLGVLAQFEKRNLDITGFDCVFGGDIPLGAGLSSSAALASGFAFAINDISNFGLSSFELVKIAQMAEHEYAGVMCGIMDQYASIFGKSERLIQLDCQSTTHQYFPLKMDEHIIALVNTNVKHSLASSEYNLRRQECERGVQFFKIDQPEITSLRGVKIQTILDNERNLDPVTYKRCKYVVEENNRVEQATEALKKSDYTLFGSLMYQSHEGLSKHYEVSCPELDFLVEETNTMQEVLGARMMGGGFGGCTINLIEKSFATEFERTIKKSYLQKFATKADVYFVKIGDGTRRIEL